MVDKVNRGTAGRRFLHADERGSIVAHSDSAGNVTAINRYDEYGLPASGNAGRLQYTGQAWLPEIGLFYYRARMYDPRLGRFLQTDPIGYGDGMNLYAYVRGDPVNFVDPTGLCGQQGQAPCESSPIVVCAGMLIKGRCWRTGTAEFNYRSVEGLSGYDASRGPGVGGGSVSFASIGSTSQARQRQRQPLPRCLHRPSARSMNRATNTALAEIYGDRAGQPRTSPLTSEFSRIGRLPDFRRNGWTSVPSSHSAEAWELQIPSSESYVIKVYIGDQNFGGANTATITHPTYSAYHVRDFLPFNFGVPVNARNAADYLRLPCY